MSPSLVKIIEDVYKHRLLPHKPNDVQYYIHVGQAIAKFAGWENGAVFTKYDLPIFIDKDIVGTNDGKADLFLHGWYESD